MTRKLATERRAARAGKATSAVAFLHGYGADANDLIGLADPLAPHLPETVFLAADAPEPCRGNPFGRQWFPIPWLDGSSQEEAAAGMAQAAADLDAWIDALLADEGLTPDRLILFGFSQGTMMALHVAPRRTEAVAGIVAFSGRLLVPEQLAAEAVSRPPVLLVHGDADPVVPFEDMRLAGEALVGAGFETYGHVMRGEGHTISMEGLSVAAGFIRDRFGVAEPG